MKDRLYVDVVVKDERTEKDLFLGNVIKVEEFSYAKTLLFYLDTGYIISIKKKVLLDELVIQKLKEGEK